MDYGPQAGVAAAIVGAAIAYTRNRLNLSGLVHVAIVFGVPVLASIVMTILGLMAGNDDAHVAFGLAAVLFYCFFAIPAYVLLATITEIVIKKVRKNNQTSHPPEKN